MAMSASSSTRRGPPTLPGSRAAGVLADTRAELEATREIQRAIARSRGDTQPAFEAIARLALKLCNASTAAVLTYDGTLVHLGAAAFTDPAGLAQLRQFFPRPPSRDSAATRAVLTRSMALIPDITADPEYKLSDKGVQVGFRSVLALPLLRDRQPLGAIAVGRPEPGPFGHQHVALLENFADQATIALETARLAREIEVRDATIRALQDTRVTDNMLGHSPLLAQLCRQIAQMAATDSTVLIEGETGTGKELAARGIHAASPRHERPFIRIDCATLSHALAESELFGHEQGAFTGAMRQRRGGFELADRGTLFLDEVAELPLHAQARLNTVLQERSFQRLGGTSTLRVDVRVIAATSRDLRGETRAGRFNPELLERLGLFRLQLPTLRDRREDVPLLLEHFARQIARRLGRPFEGLDPGFVARATMYSWPGNVRELQQVVERALLLSRGGPLDATGAVSRRPQTLG
jgi:transcriptional regulator with GAF, ATPase, and Fis domain